MGDTPTRDAKLVDFLNEAYTKEKQVETALRPTSRSRRMTATRSGSRTT